MTVWYRVLKNARGVVAAAILFATIPHAGAAAPPARPVLAVLVYHRFDPIKPGPTTVTNRIFEQQLDWLAAHHIQILPLTAMVAAARGAGPAIASSAVAITVDDGHESVYSQLYPILQRRHLPVTLFIYPSAISNASYALTWTQLMAMKTSGLVDIQSHTFWHPNFRTERKRRTPQDYQAFVDLQLTRSKSIIDHRLGGAVTMLAWPFGIVDPDLETAASRAGYVAAFAYEGGKLRPGDDPLALSRIPVSDRDRGPAFAALFGGAP